MEQSEQHERALAAAGGQFSETLQHVDVLEFRPLGGVLEVLSQFVHDEKDALAAVSRMLPELPDQFFELLEVARAFDLFGEAYDVEHRMRNPPGLSTTLAKSLRDAAGDGRNETFAGSGDQDRKHRRHPLRPVDRTRDLRDVGRRTIEKQMGQHQREGGFAHAVVARDAPGPTAGSRSQTFGNAQECVRHRRRHDVVLACRGIVEVAVDLD
ncbi:hypothetical protein [Bradyrhizobium sp. 15]|uniref:hypothetical protein n=1 Tax=Bradyrhizobium sp. 15 TaxID=2782633 RepID=UPI001FF893D0|nr:hypothetical protein [Bradyrhizobium sp. 15]